MASNESVAIQSSSMQEDDYDFDDAYDYQPHPHHNPSRLSMCTSNSTVYGHDDDDDGCGGGVSDANCSALDEGDKSDGGGHSLRMFMSRLSIENFDADADADADEEFSDEIEGKQISGGLSSDSDKELLLECYSLPATPPRRRNRSQQLQQLKGKGLQLKEYGSENETQTQRDRLKMRRRKRGRSTREIKWLGRPTVHALGDEEDTPMIEGGVSGSGGCERECEGEGEGEGEGESGGNLVVITRPKGGKRSLCMDLEEVKACRELGFELEHEIMPTRLSISASTLDTSSGGNSPISNWRISSPGDDPRDVKARLKVWAQAVALASTSRHSC